MAEIKPSVKIEGSITLTLTETEARALEAIAGYGDEAFLECFYKHLGTSYLRPHAAGVTSLFERIRRDIPHALSRFDAARMAFLMPNPGLVRQGIERMRREAMEKARKP